MYPFKDAASDLSSLGIGQKKGGLLAIFSIIDIKYWIDFDIKPFGRKFKKIGRCAVEILQEGLTIGGISFTGHGGILLTALEIIKLGSRIHIQLF